MDQDVALGVTTTITQADIPPLRNQARLGEYAVVYRCHRTQAGGGFGDQAKHPTPYLCPLSSAWTRPVFSSHTMAAGVWPRSPTARKLPHLEKASEAMGFAARKYRVWRFRFGL